MANGAGGISRTGLYALGGLALAVIAGGVYWVGRTPDLNGAVAVAPEAGAGKPVGTTADESAPAAPTEQAAAPATGETLEPEPEPYPN